MVSINERRLRLVVGRRTDQSRIDRIRSRFPFLEIEVCETEEDQDRALSTADILFTRMLPRKPILAPNLKWVHFMWEGVDSMSDEFRDSDILLTNSSGAHADHIAEHVFAFLLNLARRTRLYMELQERKEWLGWWDQPNLEKLRGSTIGIMGYGRIGRAIASVAAGFGMRVIALKREPKQKAQDDLHLPGCRDVDGRIPDRIVGPDGIMGLLGESDHVVVALPYTSETHQLVGWEHFQAMKGTAFFVNIGRGALVDEGSLIKALGTGEIAGAGLDVFEKEPLPPDSPLWSMKNVIITPHSSVGGDPAEDQVIDLFCENMERFIKGEDMINLVDKRKGY
jgi:phosphoglycerate dehydrogenase-like enzyme